MKYQLEVYIDKMPRRKRGEFSDYPGERISKGGKKYSMSTIEHKESDDLLYLVKLVSTMIQLAKKNVSYENISWTISENFKPILQGDWKRKHNVCKTKERE